MNEKTDRNKQILKSREQGDTLQSIASRHNISKEMVRQIVKKYNAVAARTFHFPGFQRCENCLKRHWGLSLFNENDIHKVVEMDIRDIFRTKDLGRKTILQLSDALQQHGYIEDARGWIWRDIVPTLTRLVHGKKEASKEA